MIFKKLSGIVYGDSKAFTTEDLTSFIEDAETLGLAIANPRVKTNDDGDIISIECTSWVKDDKNDMG